MPLLNCWLPAIFFPSQETLLEQERSSEHEYHLAPVGISFQTATRCFNVLHRLVLAHCAKKERSSARACWMQKETDQLFSFETVSKCSLLPSRTIRAHPTLTDAPNSAVTQASQNRRSLSSVLLVTAAGKLESLTNSSESKPNWKCL